MTHSMIGWMLRWADPVHFHYGDGLVKELHKTMTRLADKRA